MTANQLPLAQPHSQPGEGRAPYSASEWKAATRALVDEAECRRRQLTQQEQGEIVRAAVAAMRTTVRA